MRSRITLAALLVKVTARMRSGGTPAVDEMGDAVGDDARLARAGARQYQHGAFGSENGFALAFVESVEKRHRVRRVRWVGQEGV